MASGLPDAFKIACENRPDGSRDEDLQVGSWRSRIQYAAFVGKQLSVRLKNVFTLTPAPRLASESRLRHRVRAVKCDWRCTSLEWHL